MKISFQSARINQLSVRKSENTLQISTLDKKPSLGNLKQLSQHLRKRSLFECTFCKQDINTFRANN